MDEMRKVVTPEPSYSGAERDILYRSLIFLAKKLTEVGHNVIIDATGNLRRWRELARELIAGYAEVYLKCPIEICIQREQERAETRGAPRDVYRKGAEGWPVPGAGAPYETPLTPEITIDTELVTLEETVRVIEEEISRLKT